MLIVLLAGALQMSAGEIRTFQVSCGVKYPKNPNERLKCWFELSAFEGEKCFV